MYERSGGLDEARRLFVKRALFEEMPSGYWVDYFKNGHHKVINPQDYIMYNPIRDKHRTFDRLKRWVFNWQPDDTEVADCCLLLKLKSPDDMLEHCCGAEHIANLYGVNEHEVLQAEAAIDMIKRLRGV